MKHLHIYQSVLKNESRILKEIDAIRKTDFDRPTDVIGIWETGLSLEENIGPKHYFKRLALWTKGGPVRRLLRPFYLVEWAIRVTFKYWNDPLSVVQAHSVLSLPVSVILKLRHSAALIYDAHELESERFGMKWTSKAFCRLVERLALPFCDQVFVVSKSIEGWYKDRYRDKIRSIDTIRNIPRKQPFREKGDLLNLKFQIPKDDLIFIMQGFLLHGRCIRELIGAFEKLPLNKHLVFLGSGEFEPFIVQKANSVPNIHHHPMVPSDEVLNYTSSADCGLCLIESTCLSYYHSSPNKMFEYILSGLPLVASNFPEMSSIVRENDLGWACEPTGEAIARLISKLTKKDILEKRETVLKKQELFSWDKEVSSYVGTLKKIYEERLDFSAALARNTSLRPNE